MIRFVEISNQEFLEDIIRDNFQSTMTMSGEHPFVLNSKYKKHTEFIGYIAYDDSTVVGIAFVFPFHSKEAYSCTYNFNIYLMKAYRGKGIAEELFGLFMKGMRVNREVKNLIITVFDDQIGTIRWLQKNDFIKLGSLDDIDTNGHLGKNIAFLVKKLF